MALFQRSFYGEDPSFTNLFRMLDDFATYSREVQGPQGTRAARHQRLFNPRFDVRETEAAFELHGELPGIDRENLSIEFTEPQTLVIRGRVERNYAAGTPPTATPAVEEATPATEEANTHQASASDEETEAARERGESTEVAAPAKTQAPAPVHRPKERYWHQERSIGEFSRTFNFHTRVDEGAVTANLDRGVLHVKIPKAAKHEARRVNIE